MKKLVLVTAVLMVAGFASAQLSIDFEAPTYTTGSLRLQDGWLGAAPNTSTGNGQVAVDPIGGDQAASLYGNGGNLRGLYLPLAGNTVANGSVVSLSLDMLLANNLNQADVSFGLANGGAASGWGDYEAFVQVNGGNLLARDGASTISLLAGAFTNNLWHAVQLDVNTLTDTYNVFFDSVQVGTNLAFRNGVQALDLDALKFYANGTGSTATLVYIDNVSLAVIPEPATIGLVGIFGVGLLFARRHLKV